MKNTTVGETSRMEDAPGVGPQEDITVGQFCGDWIGTNTSTRGIARISIRAEDRGLSVRAFGAGEHELNDWGTVLAEVFAEGASATRVRAFRAFYDFGFLETWLQAKTEKGVLVIASFNRFKDQSGRSNYFSREFFYRASI
jgi:hypothetical protein